VMGIQGRNVFIGDRNRKMRGRNLLATWKLETSAESDDVR